MIKTVYQDSHRSPGFTQKDRPAGNPKSTTDTQPGQHFLHKQNHLQSGSWVRYEIPSSAQSHQHHKEELNRPPPPHLSPDH